MRPGKLGRLHLDRRLSRLDPISDIIFARVIMRASNNAFYCAGIEYITSVILARVGAGL